MTDEKTSLSLDKYQALVLFEFLSRHSETGRLSIEDQAEERVLWDLCADLETQLVEPFQPGYKDLLEVARAHVRDHEPMKRTDDPYDLARFIRAQEHDYAQALSEIRSGRKRSHWMWYIFPQFDGLGFSATSRRYAIRSAAEAEAYLRHPILGPRLVEIAEAAAGIERRSAFEVFGSPDDMKLHSCATLFARVSPAGSVFERLLARYFGGEPDGETLRLLGQQST